MGTRVPVEGSVAVAAKAAERQHPQWNGQPSLSASECNQLVEVLLSEEYERDHEEGLVGSSLLQKLYYFARPLLGVPVRRLLQRISLRNWTRRAFPNWPVDRTVDSIHEQALIATMRRRGLRRIPFIWFWPHARQAAFVMTHDVETRAGLEFCPTLMDWDEHYGIRASFQIVPEERYHVSERQLQEIRNRGFEVNVHDLNHDGMLFNNRKKFVSRAEKINSYGVKFRARGFRSGALYRNQGWFGALNFEYDMSVPNVGHLDPQHGGCCTLFPYFIGNLLELPVTMIQDYSLFHILNDYSISIWQKQIEIIRQHHGLAEIITHPDYLRSGKARRTYHALLSHVAEERDRKNLWVATPSEVNDWWRQRSRMELRCIAGAWEVHGEGSASARVAYAELDENGLRYVLEEHQQHPRFAATVIGRQLRPQRRSGRR